MSKNQKQTDNTATATQSSTTPLKNSSAHWLCTLQDNIIFDLGGGPRICQIRYIINSFKSTTFFYLIFLMWFYQNFSTGAYLYAALHGSYGWLWISKELTFPDKTWQRQVTFGSFLVFVGGNLLFWSMGWIAISGNGISDPSNSRMAASVIIMIFGSALMLVSDAQKFYTLRVRPGVLISDGTFKYTRNPNYLGESLIYLSFAAATGNYISYAIVILQTAVFFNIMTKVKDIRSYELKSGWKQYQAISGRLLPKIASSTLITYAFYGLVAILVRLDYNCGGAITYLNNAIDHTKN